MDEPLSLNDSLNKTLSESSLTSHLTTSLARIWNFSSQTDLSLSEGDLDTIDTLKKRSHELIDTYFERILRTANERRKNLSDPKRVRHLSLGEDCLPRTLLTRWGLKPPAKLGEKSHPFDLAIHPLETVLKLLEDDFDGYLDPKEMIFDDKLDICTIPRQGIHFNHEKGREYSNNNFAKLIETYKRRIDNFRLAVRDPSPIVFVTHIRRPDQLYRPVLSKICSELRRMRNGNYFELKIVNTWSHLQNNPQNTDQTPLPPEANSYDISYPFSNYIWYNELHASSELGHFFETQLISQLSQRRENSIISQASDGAKDS